MGFSRAQIDRIVERAGVARGTFYFHFPTKEHVLLELQRRHEASIVQSLAAIREEATGSVKAFLRRVIEAIAADAETIGDPALTREILAFYVRQPQPVDQSTLPLFVAIVDYFAAAAERREVRADISPEEIAGIFLTSLFGFVIGTVESMEGRLSDFDRFIEVFVRGIAP